MEASRDTVKIEDKLNQLSIKNEGKDQEKCGGKEEKIRQLLQELIESEMKYVEDLNEVGYYGDRSQIIDKCLRFAGIIFSRNRIKKIFPVASTGNI